MIEMRDAQLGFSDGLIAEEVGDLSDHCMKAADRVLADAELITAVYEALALRHPKSRSRGRGGTAAELVLRMLVLKHVRNWSYRCWGAKCAPISCIATSHAWAAARSQTPATARADIRQDCHHSVREMSGSRAQNAGGYDGGGVGAQADRLQRERTEANDCIADR